MSDEFVDAFNKMALESFQLAHGDKNLDAALERIAAFLDQDTEQTMRSHALLHRSIILELFARDDDARRDLVEAHALTQAANDHRFGIELGLLGHARRRGNRDDELQWLKRAAHTAANDPTTSGDQVAIELIAHRGGEASLPADERKDCERIVNNGWTLFQLPGIPDPSSLVDSLQRVRDARNALNERLREESRRGRPEG